MKKDKCISCKKDTQYDEITHIDSRYYYIEGAATIPIKSNSTRERFFLI